MSSEVSKPRSLVLRTPWLAKTTLLLPEPMREESAGFTPSLTTAK